jgi:hypothetical protein
MDQTITAGVFFDKSMCELDGNGIGLQIQDAQPDVHVMYRCDQLVEKSA